MEAGGALFGLFIIAFMGFCALLSVAGLAFWIWMLIDCAQNTPDRDNQKLVWILIIVFASWIGALIYFFVQRPKNQLG